MAISWESLAVIKDFLQLNFLFSGLEVSSGAIFAARVSTFLVLSAVLAFGSFKIIMKFLDCFQALLASLTRLPKSFFLLLILVLPLSPESLGARWSGYIVLAMSVAGLAMLGGLLLVLWKYGVDQALCLLDRIKTGGGRGDNFEPEPYTAPENSIRPLMDPPAA